MSSIETIDTVHMPLINQTAPDFTAETTAGNRPLSRRAKLFRQCA